LVVFLSQEEKQNLAELVQIGRDLKPFVERFRLIKAFTENKEA
jgi:hypothetical protein